MIFNSGIYIKSSGYKEFKPDAINKSYRFDDPELQPLVEQATIKLGELNAYGDLVPDIEHFIQLHVVKEATVSSKIEGTQTNMEEALLKEDDIDPEKRNDWKEVQNYIQAMNEAVAILGDLPLSSRMLKAAHAKLMEGVRGESKLPGEFRRSQNWIGGATLKDAAFIPPSHHEVEKLMGDLENFIHNDHTGLPHVIKSAIAHYQFETIHPFLDGNGRIGRLMITLYFIQAGIMKKPVLFLSDFFERNRQLYYDNLTLVRDKNDLKRWLKFFLIGIIETCDKATDGLRNILKLKADCETNRIPTLGKKMANAQLLLQALFKDPIVRQETVAKITGLSSVSSYKLIEDFEKVGILKEITGGQRNRVYIFYEYYKVFN